MKHPVKYGIVFLFLLQVVFFLTADIRLILDLIPDDAAYYFKIAENFNKGYGFSFDSIHQTNGFQPLWQYILIAVYFFTSPEPETFYRIVIILQLLMVSAALYVLFVSIKKSKGEINAYTSLIIILFFVYLQAVNGMESSLIVLMLVLVYAFYNKSIFTSVDYFTGGVLTGLLILSRLDFIFFPGIFFVILLLRSGLKNSTLYISGFLLLFLPYALINFIYTGHFQPISGVLKSSFPEVSLFFDLQFTFTGIISVFLTIPAVLYFIFKNIKGIKRDLTENQLLLTALSFTILIHYLFYLLFIKWPVLNYYIIFYGVILSFIAAEINISKIVSLKLVKPSFILVIILLLVKTGWRINKDLDNSWHAKTYDAALWVKNNTDPEDIFAMKDAGNISFLSGTRVINLDGLVNDYYFQEVLKNKKLKEYLTKNNVSYYALYDPNRNSTLSKNEYQDHRESFISYKYMVESDSLIINRSKEVYREVLGNNSAIIIWKLK
jgi:hypothetical protein